MAEYDPDEYYIHSTDRKGHGSSMRVQVPPDVSRRIHVLIADPRLPYKTPSDLIRDSIIHRIAKLEADLPDLEPSVNAFVLEAKLSERVAHRQACERLIQQYNDELWAASPAERVDLIADINDILVNTPITDSARDELERLVRRYTGAI